MESEGNVPRELYDAIRIAGKKIYAPIAKANREKLVIPDNWRKDRVNGTCGRYMRRVTISIFGGLVRRPEISPEAVVIVMCHELGHAYGGAPYLNVGKKYAAEGIADYFSANSCSKRVFAELELQGYIFQPTPFMENACNTMVDEVSREVCLRTLAGGLSIGNLIAILLEKEMPDYETPDPTVVDKTLISYPETAQCRVDTFYAGVFDEPKPACWFRESL
jgi:hypothetical protein